MAQPLHNSSDRPDFDIYPSTVPPDMEPLLPQKASAGRDFRVQRGGLLSRLRHPDFDRLKRSFTLIKSRAAGGAADLRDTAKQGVHAAQCRATDGFNFARTRATDGARFVRQKGERYAREYPLQSLAAIGAAAFLAGALIRLGRSSYGSRNW